MLTCLIQLATDDFVTLAQSDSQVLYALDPSITILLFWVLQLLAQYITCAASHRLYCDPTIPFAGKGYIPQFYFNHISMQQLDILTVQNQSFLNPLNGYMTRENLTKRCQIQ